MDSMDILRPKQPFFLNATQHYIKYICFQNGISHFYSFIADDGNADASGIPDGCMDVLYCCDERKPEVILCGTGFSPRILEINSGVYYFGVRFLPGYSPQFKSVSFAETVGRDIVFEELIREHDSFERIVSSRNFMEQIRIFLDWYREAGMNEGEGCGYDLKSYLRRRIMETRGTVTVKQLVQETQYSDRYIAKTFKQNFGMTPKVFSEIIKFQSTLHSFQGKDIGDVNFMDLAMENEYYDESHMLRYFRRYMNETPKEYLQFVASERYYTKLDVKRENVPQIEISDCDRTDRFAFFL